LFRRSERHDPLPDEHTLAGRAAASQAFLALDDEQRAVADAVRAADELGPARPLGPEWARVAAGGDRATEAWVRTTTEFPLDGTGPLVGARDADARALAAIEAAREDIRRFRAAHARVLDEAVHAIAGLPVATQEARVALTAARGEVARAGEAGIRSRRAQERLTEAEAASASLDAGGVRERRAAAARVTELARSAADLAREAPRTAGSVRGAFASIATRRAAALTKIERIEPALSGLRREFSEPCSRDLADAAAQARAAVADADRALASARSLADAGDWDDAADAVADARTALGRAEERHDAVTGRLADLREVRADPAKAAADVRFVLRDVQRLVVDRGLVARFGPVLDAQSTRLQNAQDRLTGVHPDFWLYVTELRGVRARAQEVVAQVREAAAH
jgi:hypothetical protein